MPISRLLSKHSGFPKLSLLLLALAILGCGGSKDSTAPPDLTVTRIVLTAEDVPTIVLGEHVQLSATAYNARDEVLDSVRFTYESTNTNIALVIPNGMVFPVLVPGVAQITAKSGSIISNPITITVPYGPPNDVQPVGFADSLEVGTSTTARLRVVDIAGTPIPNITAYLDIFARGSIPNTQVVSDANGILTIPLTIGTNSAAPYRLNVSVPPYILKDFYTFPKPGAPVSLSMPRKYTFIPFPGSYFAEIIMFDRYGNSIPADRATYTVRNPSVIRVSALQWVTIEGLSMGQSIVTATANGFSDSTNVVLWKYPGMFVGTRINQFEFKTDTVFTTHVFMSPEGVRDVGSATIRLTWDPNVLIYQSSGKVFSSVDPVINDTQASSGILTFAFVETEGFSFPGDVLSLTFKTASTVGVQGTIKAEVLESTSTGTFSDLLPYTTTFSQLIRLR